MPFLDYIPLGFEAFFGAPSAFHIAGIGVPITLLMVFLGYFLGVVVGATPGLAGPTAMAIALPILISIFGYTEDALLPVLGFLIGIMKGATLGGAVPAILFNTPGTPDAFMTTLDGYPLAQKGQSRKALAVAHLSSASGDTFSDIVLILCAPFLAVAVEAYLFIPEKAALLVLSLSFVAAVIGNSVAKGMVSLGLGLLAASVGTGSDFYPRLSFGLDWLANGFPIAAAVLGILVVGEVFVHLERLCRTHVAQSHEQANVAHSSKGLDWSTVAGVSPYIAVSAVVGTIIGALPGLGSTLAATLGYVTGRSLHRRRKRPEDPDFGEGAPQGLAATEAANSAVSGANLIPVLSLGIPGNAAAVFIILAADSIGGFNPGPSVFRTTEGVINPETVVAFGLFVAMMFGNVLHWTIGRVFMRLTASLVHVPQKYLYPVVLLLTVTAMYVEQPGMEFIVMTLGFGFLGYFMRRVGMSPLPFVIAYILAGTLEETVRQAFAVTGGDPFFLFSSPIAAGFMFAAFVIVALSLMRRGRAPSSPPEACSAGTAARR